MVPFETLRKTWSIFFVLILDIFGQVCFECIFYCYTKYALIELVLQHKVGHNVVVVIVVVVIIVINFVMIIIILLLGE